MSKLSKTAAAAMKAGESVTKKVQRTDEDLIRELRNDRAAHIWPSVPAIDALLRAYDALLIAFSFIDVKERNYGPGYVQSDSSKIDLHGIGQ